MSVGLTADKRWIFAMTAHLAVAISAHGFGHGAQTTAVLTALRAQRPQARLTLLTGLPREFLQGRIPGEFRLIDWRGDFGMRMDSALDVDRARSAADYAAFHADWESQVAATAQRLAAVGADLLLANVPYLPLAAAARIGLPSAALCSLNWAGIYRSYFGARPEAPALLAAMIAAYNSAETFLCPAPSMPMPELRNVRPIGPLARLGRVRQAELRAQLGLGEGQRLVLVTPGGIPLRLPVERWTRQADVHWIVPADWNVQREDVHSYESLGWPFTDVLASVDAVLGKLGYGLVAECACNGVPLLYVPRPDWPEEPFLADWLRTHGRCAPVARAALLNGDLHDLLAAACTQPAPPPPPASGAEQAAAWLAERLGGG